MATRFGRLVQILEVAALPVAGERRGAYGPSVLFAAIQPLVPRPRPQIAVKPGLGGILDAPRVPVVAGAANTRLAVDIFRYAAQRKPHIYRLECIIGVACVQPVMSTLPHAALTPAAAAAMRAAAVADENWLYWSRVCGVIGSAA